MASKSRPLSTAWPEWTVFWRGSNPMMLIQVTLLPQPDSPTIASVSPFSTLNEMPSTAWTMPSSVLNEVLRSLTSRRAISGGW
jgi:hypothetical protein